MKKNQLMDMVIDEVSSVDVPANQHGLIAFAKALGANQEDTMSVMQDEGVEVFDAEGAALDPEALEHGDTVYDGDGNEFIYVEDAEEPEPVGKGFLAHAGQAGAAAKGAGKSALEFGRKNKKALGIGAAAGGIGGAAATGAFGKSLGDSVLEELSKAVDGQARDAIVAKALGQVSLVQAQNEELAKALEDERDIRLTTEFISKAEDYNLPVEPNDFGPVLKRLVERMPEDDLELLDQVFKAAGEMLYQEVGRVGGGANTSIVDEVDSLASEMVGKADGTFSKAEATVALFEANPDAYDAYMAEGQGR